MKKASCLALLGSFFREKAGALFLCLLVAGLFLMIGSLSHMDMEPLWYALQLSGVVLAVTGILSWARFHRKHRLMEAAFSRLETLPEGLPTPAGRLEDTYQSLLAEQARLRLQEKNEQTRKIKEREDYYTLWMHQIKTPLSAMRLLLQSGDTPDLGQLEEELFKTERYAEMALHYLRLESLSDDFVLHTLDLYSIVKKAVKKYALLFIHKKITLVMEPFEEKVLTDEKWFQVLLEQILSNAVKYTQQGTVRIYVQEGPVLIIADSGVGIPKEDLPRVFDRGFTGHNGRVDQRATGIGLYLAKEVAQKLGHRLSIHSELGRGTEVTIDVSENPLKVF
jgi:signal transduction histidine kinase